AYGGRYEEEHLTAGGADLLLHAPPRGASNGDEKRLAGKHARDRARAFRVASLCPRLIRRPLRLQGHPFDRLGLALLPFRRRLFVVSGWRPAHEPGAPQTWSHQGVKEPLGTAIVPPLLPLLYQAATLPCEVLDEGRQGLPLGGIQMDVARVLYEL